MFQYNLEPALLVHRWTFNV